MVSVESGVDPDLVRSSAGEPAAVIELKTGTRIWIAAGFTDLRRGFQGLTLDGRDSAGAGAITPAMCSSSAASAVI